MRRGLCVVTLLAVGAGYGFCGGSGESTSGASPSEGRIEFLDGEVTVGGADAEFGQIVPVGSVVRTGTESSCEIVFQDRNIFQIRENTTVTVSIDAVNSRLAVQQGTVAAVFDQLQHFGDDGSFVLDANVATAGVRGTVFFIEVEDPDTTYICTCNGKLAQQAGGKSRTVRTGHHRAYRYRRTAEGVRIEVAPLEDHGDQDMDALAAKIGVIIDWKN